MAISIYNSTLKIFVWSSMNLDINVFVDLNRLIAGYLQN